MGKCSVIKMKVSLEELDKLISTTVGAWRIKRMMVIRMLLVEPQTAAKVAKAIGYSIANVHQIVSGFNRNGLTSFELKGRGQRQNAHLSLEEEVRFFNSIAEKLAKGEKLTVLQVKEAFEERVGEKVHESTVYRLIKRHNWQKILHRPRKPKSDIAEQEKIQ
jgi:transposase